MRRREVGGKRGLGELNSFLFSEIYNRRSMSIVRPSSIGRLDGFEDDMYGTINWTPGLTPSH